MSARVLVIDSRPEEAKLLAGWLKEQFEAEVEQDPEAGWQRLAEGYFDALLLEDGLLPARRVLRRLEENSLGCFLVLFGERPSPERALAAVMAGAFAFLLRPLSGGKVSAALKRGLRNRKKLLGIMAMSRELREANGKLIHQKRRLQEEKRHLAAKGRQLNLLNELSRAASSTLEPDRILGAVSARLCRGLPLASWAVLFAPPGSERAALFVPGSLPAAAGAALGRQMLERLARAGGRAVDLEVRPLERRALPPGLARRLSSEEGLILPLLAAGAPIGLYKFLPEQALSADLVRLAESAANMVALGLRNAGELMLARRLADHDALTSIANRRAFERQLRQEFSRSRRYHQPLTLVMADIDHFKQVNDRYGHQVGDRVLSRIARALSAAVRESDFVARYGGEEFALILPQTELESSLALVWRIKRAVEGRRLVAGSRPLRLTLSMGLADTAAPQAEEALDLVRLADHALYLSKSAGRNRVSTWKDITDLAAPLAHCTGRSQPVGQPGEAI
jgi:diguanylate cyclase (GGDEF)-like protein